MITVRYLTARLCSRCYSRSFYNDDYKPHHPFENTVQLKFTECSPTDEEFHSFFRRGKHITGSELWFNDQTAFVNFSNSRTKHEHVTSAFSSDFPYPHTLHDYSKDSDFSRDTSDIRLPFNRSVLAAFRPSLHSAPLIYRRLCKFGYVNGYEVVKCPYDKERAFMYCNFQQKKSLVAAIRSESVMPGYAVIRKDTALNSNICEDVEILPNSFTEYWRFGTDVNVMFEREPSDEINGEITTFLEQYGEIETTDHQTKSDEYNRVRVKFKHPISVYRLFYWKTMFGRVCKTLPHSGTEIKMTIPQSTMSGKHNHLHAVELNGIVLRRGEGVFDFCSKLLNSAECNPGIISAIYMPNDSRIFIKLLSYWYVRDVGRRLSQFLNSEKAEMDFRYEHIKVNGKHY